MGWDYASDGAYFVTICTKDMKHSFGEIVKGEMYFSEIGHVAKQCWLDIVNHFPCVTLGAYVIMPNHIHGIIIINRVDIMPVSKNPGTLGAVVRGFKIGVTHYCKWHGISFEWQARFYEHIIRDVATFIKIERYIDNNVRRWKD